jgi:tRNA(Arg) A34 adenosine deaminase TadA
MEPSAFSFHLPAWVEQFLAAQETHFPTPAQQMALVVALSERNVEEGTGGPFAAGVFELDGGRLVAPGINLVHREQCAVLHAEVVAVMLAQRRVGHYDLSAPGLAVHGLVTSTEPCTLCQGATLWSGVRSLTCGARDSDARAIGFDEGPKAADWAEALSSRGIRVTRDICREEAVAVLRRYRDEGGLIYNARREPAD